MRMRSFTLVMLIGALALSGCSAQHASDSTQKYSAQTARPLQEQVLAVAESSATGDPAASLTRLDELAASLKDARARGTVSVERYASITAAIALVRSDLEAAITVQDNQQKKDNPGKGKGKS